MLRTLITNHLRSTITEPNSVAVLCSGGMDSLSVVLSCMDLGIRPTLYTFYLRSEPSEDLESSRNMSRLMNLPLIEVVIEDHDLNQLHEDIISIIRRFDVKKKTAIQCIYPFLYVAPQVQEKTVLTGLCADDLYGTPRSMAKLKGTPEFEALRSAKVSNVSSSSYKQIKEVFEGYSKKFIAPYKDAEGVIAYLSGLKYKEMHSPKQKYPAYMAYQNEIEQYGLYRRNVNLQCGSKIREWHDQLLRSEHNTIGANTIIALYNHWYRLISNEESYK